MRRGDERLMDCLRRIAAYDREAREREGTTHEEERSRAIGAYIARNQRIYEVMALAREQGIESGIRIDPDAPEWPAVFLELPTGQVSWHVPQHRHDWDEHDLREKDARLAAFLEQGVER